MIATGLPRWIVVPVSLSDSLMPISSSAFLQLSLRLRPRDDSGSAGHGSSGSTNLSGSRGSRGSRVSTRWPGIKLTRFQEQAISWQWWCLILRALRSFPFTCTHSTVSAAVHDEYAVQASCGFSPAATSIFNCKRSFGESQPHGRTVFLDVVQPGVPADSASVQG